MKLPTIKQNGIAKVLIHLSVKDKDGSERIACKPTEELKKVGYLPTLRTGERLAVTCPDCLEKK